MGDSVENKSEIVITYDTLYDLLRREKTGNEIQKLDLNFFQDVINYLKEKQTLLDDKKKDHGLFGFEEKKKISQQIENTHKILKDLYDWREKKIMALARDVSRTNGLLVNKAPLLPEEQLFYDDLLATMDKFRKGVLHNLLTLNVPTIGSGGGSTGKDLEPKPLKRDVKNIKLRFTNPVSQFLGPNMVKFGPYKAGQTAELPEIVAKIILKQGNGEVVE